MLHKMNVISIHYFLWFLAMTSIYGYTEKYSNHYANVSSGQYGLFNMMLTFTTIFVKLFFCSLIDRHRAYRSFMVFFLTSALVGYGSLGVIPFYMNTNPDSNVLNLKVWIVISILISMATISMSVITCLSDSFAMNSSQRHGKSFGQIRVWGTVGWAIGSFIIAFINQSKHLPLLVPGLFLTAISIFLDTLNIIWWPDHKEFKLTKKLSISIDNDNNRVYKDNHVQNTTSQSCEPGSSSELQTGDNSFSIKVQWTLFKEVARRRKSIFRYIIIFTLSGSLISLQWVYLVSYLEFIYKDDFTYVSGIAMLSQAILGEMIFFIFSKKIIQAIGRTHALSLSFISMALRYFLYDYVLKGHSYYFIIMIESLAGPSFGMLYVILTEVGLDYSDCEGAIEKILAEGYADDNPNKVDKLRKCLMVTMQSIMSASYEGLGVGLGSFFAGLVIEYYDYHTLWIGASVIAGAVGILNSSADLFLTS